MAREVQRRAVRSRAASAIRKARPRRPLPRPRRAGLFDSPLWRYLAVLGPGLIVANAGNDAGGIFTYSNIGAKYGTALLWTVPPTLLALIVTQEMAARLGCVTGKGLMDLIRERFGVRWSLFAAIVVIVANGGTVLAEFAGVAGALGLLGVPVPVAVIGAAVLIGVLVLRGSRRIVERIFLALGLTFVSYVITAVIVHPDWSAVVHDTVIPNGNRSGVAFGPYLVDVIALIGTSITPYMQLFLQSSIVDKGSSEKDLNLVRLDVVSGSIFAALLVAPAIVVATWWTLFRHGSAGQGIASAADAARALGPLVGAHATQLFAVGLLGASLLAAAVLPLSTAFVVCEAFGAERSVERRFSEAPLFFTLVVGLLAFGAAVMLIPGISITGVAIGTQTLDGILLPVLLVFILILANDRRLVGRHANGRFFNAVAGLVVAILVTLTAGLLVATLFPALFGAG